MKRLLDSFAISLLCALAAIAAHAQDFSLLYQFAANGTQGYDPYTMNMIQATDGNFYGTTRSGGSGNVGCSNYVNCGGTIFKVDASGNFISLYTFCSSTGCPDGRSPVGGVMQASDGNFYGTTFAGGTNDQGTIFRFTPDGVLTTLHSFCNPPHNCNPNDGSGPTGLIQASNGDLYGTTNGNTLFKITLKGKFTLLDTLAAGSGPLGLLLQLPDGNIYGTTYGGGAYARGAVFKATPSGKVTTLYSFCSQSGCPDGEQPWGGMALGSDGNLYGTTWNGGTDGFGTVFKITPKGKFTLLHSFTGGLDDGETSTAPLALGSDGNLYGTTQYGGADSADGVVFQVAKGAYANVYPVPSSLCPGAHPYGGLFQSTNGNFYGADESECLYEFSMGLGPFVQPIPTFGKVGTPVIIQGTDLTGTTSVKFHGTKAKFKVVSATEISTTVPAGATTGTITVKTPGGTLKSNVTFTVN